MGFFAWLFKPRYNFNKKRKALLNKIEDTEEVLVNAKLFELRAPLHTLFDTVDDKKVMLKKDQVKAIEHTLGYIKAHAKPDFVEVLKEKCAKMVSIARGFEDTDTTYGKEVSEQNEDKLREMEIELKSIERDIEAVQGQMDEALGIDKIKWNRLNSKKKQLKTKYDVKYQSYMALSTQQENINASIALDEARDDAEYISEQRELVDPSNAQINAEASQEALNEAKEIGSKLDELIGNTFGVGPEADYDYERALESKLEKEKLQDSSKAQPEKEKVK